MRKTIHLSHARIAMAVLALLTLMLFGQPLMAQSQNISGTVIDSTGAMVPEATVKITDLAKGSVARQTTTSETGRFEAINIQPGRYSIAVEKTGFKKAELTLTLNVNAKVDVGQITLEVGQLSEMLSVEGDFVPVVQTNTMEKAYLVNRDQIQSLPMNGRNWVALMSTVPGMTTSSRNDFDMNFNDVSQFHGLGGRGSQNNFYLDGSPNLDVGDNQSQYTQPSIDSISEFRILQSSFNAEYGRNEGMAVAVQTKSGSSEFHGTAYEYLRNDFFDAKCVIACHDRQPALRYNQFGGNVAGWLPIPGISTKADKKVFFFYNREMTRRILPGSGYADVPNATIMSGNFTPWLLETNMQYAPQFKNGTVFQPGTIKRDGAGNIIDGNPYPGNIVPKSQWQTASSNLLKVYTDLIPGFANLPAAPNPGYARYFFGRTSRLRKDQDLLRIDYSISEKMNSFFRWVNDDQKEKFNDVIWGGTPFPFQPQQRPKPGSSWSWNLVNTFTPNLAAETILSYNHQSQSLSVVEPNPVDRGTLGITFPELYPQTNLTNSIPNVNAGPISWGLGNPGWHNDGKDYAFTENVTYVRGKHTMKFGFYYNRDDKKQTSTWPMNSTINFNPGASLPMDTNNGIANLMLGNFGSYSQSNAHVYPYFRFLAYEAFAQDSFKISRRLTMEYGIRFARMVPTFTYTRPGDKGGEGTWTLYTVDLKKYDASKRPQIRLSDGKIVGNPMNALSPLGLVCDPCDGTPRGFSDTKNLFAPRLGLAYDLFGDGKTAVRGGFGVFHERQRQNNFYFGAGGNWPNLASASQVNGNVSAIDLSVTQGTPEITPPGLPIWPSDAVPPSVYSWYGGIQRELPHSLSLDVSYAGNRAVHLMHQRNVNTVPAGTFVAQPNLRASVNFKDDALRPYYGWGNLNAIESLGYSRYNAMMFRLSRRMTNSLAFNFNYTLSKAQNIADTDGDQISRPYNVDALWGNASYDQTHVTTFDFIYQLPRVKSDNPFAKTLLNGWEITGMIRSQSGQPVWPSSNGSLMGVNAGTQRPDLVGDPYAGRSKHRWLNPDAFRRPKDGEYGTLARNEFRLPAVRNIDASVNKAFAITESAKVVLRGEVFNLLNNAQIWGLNTGFSADTAGTGISASNKNFGTPNSWREARIMQLAIRVSF